MRCRDYRVEDRQACLNIFHSNTPDYFAPKELCDVTRLLDERLCPYLVIEDDDGTMIASGGIWIDQQEQTATLCWVMVERQFHGRGVGRFVVLKLLSLLRRFPFVTVVKLDTSQHTVAFYEKLGFTKTAFTENYYADALHRYDMQLDWSIAQLEAVAASLATCKIAGQMKRDFECSR